MSPDPLRNPPQNERLYEQVNWCEGLKTHVHERSRVETRT